MLGDQADQRHEADLRVDVDRAGPQVDRRIVLHHAVDLAQDEQHEERAEHRGGQADEDDEGIAEALELRGENQVDEQQRNAEGDGKRVAFLDELAALALEVIGHALRHQLVGLLLQERHRLADGAARERHALEHGRVQLLEGRQARSAAPSC